MLDKSIKANLLREAIKIAKEHAGGGSSALSADYVLEAKYRVLIKKSEEIHSESS